MRAMVLDKAKQPLQARDVPKPKPGEGQLLVRVNSCAVCRTDLHVMDGELPNPKLLATGGLAPRVIPECNSSIRHEPDLTLIGLRLLYERNTEPR